MGYEIITSFSPYRSRVLDYNIVSGRISDYYVVLSALRSSVIGKSITEFRFIES